MRVGLKYPLFLVLVSANLLLLLAVFAINQWIFSRGFREYVAENERSKLQPVMDALAASYRQQGNWDRMVEDHRSWREILNTHLLGPNGVEDLPPPPALAPPPPPVRPESPAEPDALFEQTDPAVLPTPPPPPVADPDVTDLYHRLPPTPPELQGDHSLGRPPMPSADDRDPTPPPRPSPDQRPSPPQSGARPPVHPPDNRPPPPRSGDRPAPRFGLPPGPPPGPPPERPPERLPGSRPDRSGVAPGFDASGARDSSSHAPADSLFAAFAQSLPNPPAPPAAVPAAVSQPAPSPGLPPPPPPRDREATRVLAFDPRLYLADASHQLLLGDPRKIPTWLEIELDGQVIGYLGYLREHQLGDELDQIFAREQRNSLIYAALGLLLISALIAWPLAAWLVRPIRQLTLGADQLAAGDYAIRLPTTRRDELGDLAENFNRLAETLEQNLEARQQWIAEISHELRTPVAILRGEIEAIQDKIRPASEQNMGSLHQEVGRLNQLIDDLHELTMADLGALNYQMGEVDLAELLRECIDNHETALANSGLEVRIQGGKQAVKVLGDDSRLMQVLDNLLQNSLRYTQAPGQIVIRLARQGRQVGLKWSDTAPGVKDEDLPRLFDRLYRAEKSRSRKLGGSGLGLAITEKIIQAHQGSIRASHSSLGGLSIALILPAYRGG